MPLARRSLLAAAAALATPAIGRAANAQPIRIGEINSYTAVPAFTLPYRNGWQLAVAADQRGGRRAGPAARSDQPRRRRQAADAIRLAGELVNEQKVDLLAGGFLSNIGLALSDFAKQHGVLYIAGEPLTDALVWEKGHRLCFRLRPSTYMQAAMLVPDAAKLPAKRWVTVAPNYEYGQSSVKWFRQLAESRTARCRVRGRAMARARQDRRRRHGRGARRGQARCDLQRDVRRRPDEFRAPGQHARLVRGPRRRVDADRRAGISRSAGGGDTGGLDRHRLSGCQRHGARQCGLQRRLHGEVSTSRRRWDRWSATPSCTRSQPASRAPAARRPTRWPTRAFPVPRSTTPFGQAMWRAIDHQSHAGHLRRPDRAEGRAGRDGGLALRERRDGAAAGRVRAEVAAGLARRRSRPRA